MQGNFTEETRRILMGAKKEMYELKHPYIGSEHLMLSILKDKNEVSKKLKEYDLTYDKFKNEIIKIVGIGTKENEWFLYTPLLKRIIENALQDSRENNNGNVTIEHLFQSLLEEGEGVAIRIMLGLNIDLDELYEKLSYKLVKKSKKKKKLLVEELGIDLNKKALNDEIDPVIGRDEELERIIEILSRRTKNNPILIGEAGVGKTAIIEELSKRIITGNISQHLKNKRIINLDISSVVAGTKYRGEFEERLNKIIKELENNKDIILFIDEVHTIVGAGGAEGAIDASNIMKPALARGKIKIIGATTIEEYKKYIEKDSALERRFQKVFIDVPNKETVRQILQKLKPIYEKYHLVNISDEIIDLILDYSEKYIYDRNEPDKSIDILDEVCAKVGIKENSQVKEYNEKNKILQNIIKEKTKAIIKNNFKEATKLKEKENEIMNRINELEIKIHEKIYNTVTKEDVIKTISDKTKIPIYELKIENLDNINKIKIKLKNKIIGQEEQIDKIVKLIKQIKLGFKDENKCFSILFCGPSGVGKTLLAKEFGKNLVGNNNIIKLDMSEYSESHSISKIIGAPPGYVGYQESKTLLDEIKNKPYSVLILDEIEKASKKIINLLFQILDDGKIKDSKGNIVRFDNVTIIMTSNIGFNEINIGFNKNKKFVDEKLKEYFSLPFINRIDKIINFNNMTEKTMIEIINSKLTNLKQKYLNKNIKINYKNSISEEILKETNYIEYGARKIDKIISDKIENQVIDEILNDNKEIYIKTIKDKITI